MLQPERTNVTNDAERCRISPAADMRPFRRARSDGPPRAWCPYCIGSFRPPRRDAVWCSGTCRRAASAARAHPCAIEVPRVWARRAREPEADDRKAATTYSSLTAPEAFAADLRVRCLQLGEVETREQLEAAVQLLGSVAAVALYIDVDPASLAHWGADEAGALGAVSWSWRDTPPTPVPLETP